MKIYIMTDIEGVAGVARFFQTREAERPEKKVAMTLLTREVNAAVDGILEADPAAEVVVMDGHGNGGIDITEFHPKARLINRGPLPPPGLLDHGFDGLFFVGQHARAATENGNLAHTYSSLTIEYYRLNGRLIGEFGCRAALAGSYGVPTVFISGDDRAVAEARELVPDIVGVTVKEGLGLETALHLSPARAREVIRAGAAEAVGRIGAIPPYRVEPPYELVIRVKEGVSLENFLKKGAEPLDERTVVRRSSSLNDLPI
ncbi:MAG TPA: M55 family metallopeptidase [bacterium]|uniref:D-aminopeptidase n=1 Tax=candidate division TA06 bacterium ADurb.Bin417 TaxID=1852828 RepID=A0A1V5MGC4_UNCT6|nr:MAG: D-aminopeptidase [candidate division TA06 bacterium ADurb.Bin417]HNQ34491.1 M55 family metallopeptidase [bacterium]HNS49167.1 M55 family metallopeptidase [bacterium]